MIAASALLITSDGGRDRVGTGAGGQAAESVVAPRRVYPYPRRVVRRFLSECVRSAPEERRTCRCVIDDLQTRLPYRDFTAADRAIRRGEQLSPRARRAFDAATRLCRATT